MEKASGGSGLDPMPDGVAEVQEGAGPGGFALVFFHDRRFEGDVAGDQWSNAGSVVAERRNQVNHLPVADGGVLDDFGEAFAVFPFGQRVQRIDVREDGGGLMERTEQVFALGKVDPGLPPRSYRPG